MKALMIAVMLGLLSACSGMNMHPGSSGSTGAASSQSGNGGADYYQRDDGTHTWIH
ncbi:MAG TPA: hypothetical protein VJ698_11620 [Noviherbaspirillum sp.]|uniref:hypothetical protein n=1 Tax=Noviherbaspirillum sp. TaxID=1926288 RepID=UPI002B4610DA|nr:hypothetical protein [Noviherbaspirillum sp.]HJV86111.1 hypothetical protein [Noviherbaspirillum sp.]